MAHRYTVYFVTFLSVILWAPFSLGAPLCVASLLQKAPHSELALEIGATVSLDFLNGSMGIKPGKIEGTYLGRLVELDGKPSAHAFYDEINQIIHFIPEGSVQFDGGVNMESEARLVAANAAQSLGTCAAFAMFNCIRQIHLSGAFGNGKMKTAFSSEQGRLSVLERAIMYYYGDGNHTDGIQQITSYYGLQQQEISNFDVVSFMEGVVKNALKDGVLLLRFDVPQVMSQSKQRLINHGSNRELPRKIWQPMGRYDTSAGGHMVVVSNVFKTKSGEIFLVVQDSNWQTIRLWNLNTLERLRTAHIRAWRVFEN